MSQYIVYYVYIHCLISQYNIYTTYSLHLSCVSYTLIIYLLPPIQCIGNVNEMPCVLGTGNVDEISCVQAIRNVHETVPSKLGNLFPALHKDTIKTELPYA